jgi:hypothetical protein
MDVGRHPNRRVAEVLADHGQVDAAGRHEGRCAVPETAPSATPPAAARRRRDRPGPADAHQHAGHERQDVAEVILPLVAGTEQNALLARTQLAAEHSRLDATPLSRTFGRCTFPERGSRPGPDTLARGRRPSVLCQ